MQMQDPPPPNPTRRPMHKYRFDEGFAKKKPFVMQFSHLRLTCISQVPPGPGLETPPLKHLTHTQTHLVQRNGVQCPEHRLW
jgi:hypothetical protein